MKTLGKTRTFYLLAIVIVLAISFSVYSTSAATTIGTNFSTSGTLTVGGNADYNLGGAERILIDAATTDATLTTGVLDLNVDAAGANVNAEDVAFNILGDYTTFAKKTTVTSAGSVDLSATTAHVGDVVYLAGRNSLTSSGIYEGHVAVTQSSTNNAAQYYGFLAGFNTISGGVDLGGSAAATGFQADIDRTTSTAGGILVGFSAELKNNGPGSTDALIGFNASLNTTGGAGASMGMRIVQGGSGIIQDGINISGNSTGITDGLDVSDSDIVNAINLGQNTILADGGFSIDLKRTTAATLTIQNSDTTSGAVAHVSVDGEIQAGTAQGFITGAASSAAGNPGAADLVRIYAREDINVTGAATNDCVLRARLNDSSEVTVVTLVTDAGCP